MKYMVIPGLFFLVLTGLVLVASEQVSQELNPEDRLQQAINAMLEEYPIFCGAYLEYTKEEVIDDQANSAISRSTSPFGMMLCRFMSRTQRG